MTGEEGIEKAQQEKPDLIILDTVLPDMDGFEVCKKLRNSRMSGANIVITTGFVDAVDAGLAHSVGANDHVVKTVNMSHLMETIQKYL